MLRLQSFRYEGYRPVPPCDLEDHERETEISIRLLREISGSTRKRDLILLPTGLWDTARPGTHEDGPLEVSPRMKM